MNMAAIITTPTEDYPIENPHLFERWEDEVALEEEMLALGKAKAQEKINKARKKGDLTTLRPQRSLIFEWVIPVSDYLEEWLSAQDKKRGVKPIALPLLRMVPTDTSAVVALRVMLRQLGHEHRGIVGMAGELGNWIEHEAKCKVWAEEDEEGWNMLAKVYNKRGSNQAHQRRSRISIFNKHVAGKVGWVAWTDEQKQRVGLQMIDCVIKATKRFRLIPDPNYKHTKHAKGKPMSRQLVLTGDEELMQWLSGAMDDELVHSATFLPTIIPPKPWTGPRDGGYWTPYVNTPFLIRFKASHEDQRQRAIDDYDALDMPEVYSALNTVQETPWKINERVLAVAQEFWDKDLALCGFPRREPQTVPKRPPEADLDPEIHKAWAIEASNIHMTNAKRFSQFISTRRALLLAERMRNEPRFYFPHMLDFRGRMYPIPNDLSPQGEDLHRGLLTFANAKRVTPEDAWWLAMQVANCFGVDKVSMDERVQWVDDRWEELEAMADDPIANRKWCFASDPWQALAAIFEWVAYNRCEGEFFSSLPIRVDGTCNGIQHLSAMVLDEEGGASVNLIPSDKPRDIYQEVADVLTEMLAEEAEHGNKQAATWLLAVGGRCPRTLTKRPVMILPYGGTRHSYLDYTMEWVKENDPKRAIITEADGFSLVGYLVTLLWKAVGTKVQKARDVMTWLQKSCELACVDGKPLFWKTPAGMVVRQFYGERAMRRVETKLDGQRIQLVAWETTNVMDGKAQSRAIAPNFVHSLDASCLMSAVNMARSCGVDSLTTIHDSYGTVAADMQRLFTCIREAFVEAYQTPILAQFQEACRMVNKTPGLAWPKPLPTGSLDIENIRESTYFFA